LWGEISIIFRIKLYFLEETLDGFKLFYHMMQSVCDSNPPSDTLVACNHQDITRKGAKKAKQHIMMILPTHFSINHGVASATDLEIGSLENSNTNTPSFIIRTPNALIKYPGKFVSTSTTFFTLECLPKSQQSVMSEMYQSALIFGEPIFEPIALENQIKNDFVNAETSSSNTNWVNQFGLSANVPGKAIIKTSSNKKDNNAKNSISASAFESHDSVSVNQDSVDGDNTSVASDVSSIRKRKPIVRNKRASTRKVTKSNIKKEEPEEFENDSEHWDTSDLSDDSEEDYEEAPKRRRRR
jgi:hypothetical protein